jgi:hypothetical protein
MPQVKELKKLKLLVKQRKHTNDMAEMRNKCIPAISAFIEILGKHDVLPFSNCFMVKN